MSRLTADPLAVLRRLPTQGRPNKLADALAIASVTQVEVQESTGLPQPYISDVARGHIRDIGITRAGRLAHFFGCLIEDLFPHVVADEEATRA